MQLIYPKIPAESYAVFNHMISVRRVSNERLEIYFTDVIYGDMKTWIPVFNAITSMKEGTEIHCFLMTPGGCIQTTLSIIDALKLSKAKIFMYNYALAASCGSLLLCHGDKIFCARGSSTMFHHASSMAMGSVTNTRIGVQLTIDLVEKFLKEFVQKGILKQEEIDSITDKNSELYLSSGQMIPRLKAAGLWMEDPNVQ